MSTDPEPAPPTIDLLKHYDYDEDCPCPVCADWRVKLETYQQAQQSVLGHPRSCMCDGCKTMRRLRSAYQAANNRRDVFSEMSYHAACKDVPNAAGVMHWVYKEVTSGRRTDGWWEGRAPYYELRYWFLQANKALATMAAASGQALSTIVAVVTGALTAVAAATGALIDTFPLWPPLAAAFPSGEIMKQSPVLAAAEAEAAQLRTELEKLPLFQRLNTLTQFIKAYSEQVAGAAPVKPRLAVSNEKKQAKPPEPERPVDMGPVIAGTMQLLQERKSRMLAAEIITALRARGIATPSQARVLAIHLNRKPEFTYVKNEGFGLAAWDEKATTA